MIVGNPRREERSLATLQSRVIYIKSRGGLPEGRKGFASGIDGRSLRRRTGTQVDGPSDDKVTEG